jgi:hypothetical protein
MSKVQTTGVVGYREKLVNMALGIILVYNEFRQVKAINREVNKCLNFRCMASIIVKP